MSFYGESYIWLPIEDASRQTEITLEFRTGNADGLLFLAGGTTDYCIVELQAGALRVRVDLGSGEASLGSQPGMIFNDLRWHHIHLQREEAEVTMTIDRITTIATTTPLHYYELNINKGIHVGAVAAAADVFYGHLEPFRGCMKNVLFNRHNILDVARGTVDPLGVYEVSWECSREFGATSDQPITFLQNTSFIAFPAVSMRNDGRFAFDFRTKNPTALLLYTAGHSLTNPDFLALELVGGYVKVTLDKGSGNISFLSDRMTNDGLWHQVELVLHSNSVTLSVDGHRKAEQSTVNRGRASFLDLYGNVFVGGVNVITRSRVVRSKLESLAGPNAAAGSFIGCIQNFRINGRLHGLREARITKGLKRDCLWSFPCSNDPCIDGATCVEEGFHNYNCLCEGEENCFKPGATGEMSSNPIMDVILVRDLVVQEGGKGIIDDNNLEVLLDYMQQGIRDSDVVLHVVNEPAHGVLQVMLSQEPVQVTDFSMIDLMANKVSYVHDGSESRADSVGLELEFVEVPENAPDTFHSKYGFTLMIQIAPWNDDPELRLPEGNKLILVSNTAIQVNRRILQAVDRDDPPSDLEFSISYQTGHAGYFEISDVLGVRARITSFTQEDINEKRIKFVHRGATVQRIHIQVYDRKNSVAEGTLLIKAVPFELRLVHNEYLVMPFNSERLILSDNLKFATNAPDQQFEIQYEVTQPPFDGEIQRLQYSDTEWTTVSTFTQDDVDDERIRYAHFGNMEKDDYFKYRIVVGALRVATEEHEFTVRFIKLRVDLVKNSGLELYGTNRGLLTIEELQSISSLPYHTTDDIVYEVVNQPSKGKLFRNLDSRPRRTKPQRISNNFTQSEINNGVIMYRVNKALYDIIRDSFRFRVHIPGASSSRYTFNITYMPPESDIRTINNGLQNVTEGSVKEITVEDLYMQATNIDNFLFTVLEAPMHGVIQRVNPDNGDTVDRNVSTFTARDIANHKVLYRHDDSETMEDSFRFSAVPISSEDADNPMQDVTEISDTFDIKILLRNDNPPQRNVEKVFHVVANRGRVITSSDLSYTDPDIDFDPLNLNYTFNQIINGDIVWTANRTMPAHHFSQSDLEEGNIYFQHSGPDNGKTPFWVTDGDHNENDILEVQASDPYLNVVGMPTVVVYKGGMEIFNVSTIRLDTNIDVEDKEVKFHIIELPEHGVIKKAGIERGRFNLGDIKRGNVAYFHDNTEYLEDSFDFEVRIDDIHTQGTLTIHIQLDSHDDPPGIASNEVIMVLAGESVVIGQAQLEITHPESSSREIIYTVVQPPEQGYLWLSNINDNDDSNEDLSFTQDDINNGFLSYQHERQEPVDPRGEIDEFR